MAKALRTGDIQPVLDKLLTVEDLCRMFHRTEMSIYNYRTRKHDPLPALRTGRYVVGYVKSDVLAWARRNNIHIHAEKTK